MSLDVDIAKGKANLKLSSITLADNKVFECRVQIPGDDEGTPADTARLVVLGNFLFVCFQINILLSVFKSGQKELHIACCFWLSMQHNISGIIPSVFDMLKLSQYHM